MPIISDTVVSAHSSFPKDAHGFRMKGKRHFRTKRTSLFGSEHEENPANFILSSVSPPNTGLVTRDHISKSYSYGDWWMPVKNKLPEEVLVFFLKIV